jgi:hypothetical protein
MFARFKYAEFIIIGITVILFSCRRTTLGELNAEKYVNAIYIQEGAEHTRYPYGIKSIPCRTKDACKAICLNTVRNNWTRFKRHGGTGIEDFTAYIAARYLKGDTKANQQIWRKNVLKLYGKSQKT